MGARIVATILLAVTASPALAGGILPILGGFGNDSGCRLYATGKPLSDDYVLLTADSFSSVAIGCDFNALVSTNTAVFNVEAVCSPGGKSTVRISDLGPAGFAVSVGSRNGAVSGLKACPPAGLDGGQA